MPSRVYNSKTKEGSRDTYVTVVTTQALGKKLYLVKINVSQGQIFKESGQCTVPSKALGSGP